MYQDPKRIRKHRTDLNLDDYEHALIQALVDYTGESKAELCRRMVIAQAQASLLPEDNSLMHGRRASDHLLST